MLTETSLSGASPWWRIGTIASRKQLSRKQKLTICFVNYL